MLKSSILCVCLLFALANVSICDQSVCPSVPIHYEELNCTAVVLPGESCPSRYDCPKFSEHDPNKCFVNGKFFERGERISIEDTKHPCKSACVCDRKSTVAHLNCVQYDCPEWSSGKPLPSGCVKQRSFDQCCTLKRVCAKEEIEKLSTCELEGRTYHEGEKMFPDAFPCYSCICNVGFSALNIEKSSHCRKINCSVDHQGHKLHKGCIPIYYGKNRCCPIDWRCPIANKDKVIIGEGSVQEADPDRTCLFGNLRLNVGDSLNQTKDKVTCSCTLPPIAHCVQEPRHL